MRGLKKIPEAPPRPRCMCGGDGAFQVSIEVEELVLERDAGMSAKPYWRPDYRTGTKIGTIMCVICIKANVTVKMATSASVVGKEVP